TALLATITEQTKTRPPDAALLRHRRTAQSGHRTQKLSTETTGHAKTHHESDKTSANRSTQERLKTEPNQWLRGLYRRSY
ncbi:MAG: hypothetical protein ACXWWH_09375, partial [Nitrospira sp.]